jgi:hypothetical protein
MINIAKQSQLMHNIIVYLFIVFVHLLPDMFQYTPTRHTRPDTWDGPQHKPWNYNWGRQAKNSTIAAKQIQELCSKIF